MTLPFFLELITRQQFLLGDYKLHAQTKPKNPVLLGLVYKAELANRKFTDDSDKLKKHESYLLCPIDEDQVSYEPQLSRSCRDQPSSTCMQDAGRDASHTHSLLY